MGVPACYFCGAKNAPFGFRRRGFGREIPIAARAGFWCCRACRDRGEALKAEKEAALDPFKSKRKPVPLDRDDAGQRDLFAG